MEPGRGWELSSWSWDLLNNNTVYLVPLAEHRTRSTSQKVKKKYTKVPAGQFAQKTLNMNFKSCVEIYIMRHD